jgi:hypothetical protein
VTAVTDSGFSVRLVDASDEFTSALTRVPA